MGSRRERDRDRERERERERERRREIERCGPDVLSATQPGGS